MKIKPFKRIPALIALAVIVLTCVVSWLRVDFFERLEKMTYDLRVRYALKFAPPVATNLGFVFIDEASVQFVRNPPRAMGLGYGLYWPREVYGRLIQELAEQGAKVAALDIFFAELRPDHLQLVQMADDRLLSSDDYFALQMGHASNVVLALTKDVDPPQLFRTNAMALGDVSTEKDSDGILRRAKAFRTYRRWHSAFKQLAADPEYGVDLSLARVEPREIVLPRSEDGRNEDIHVPLDADGNFDLADFGGTNLPEKARRAKPFQDEFAWHMGVLMAARELNLDLSKAEIDLPHGRITLRTPKGGQRIIPIDREGYFYIDWCIPPNHPRLTREPIQNLLAQSLTRLGGETNNLPNRWRDKLAVVGSAALVGNDLTDRGATPLDEHTLLVSKHWNVANSIISGRFVRRASLPVEFALIALMGILAALVTWGLRSILTASGLVALAAAAYIALATVIYVQTRYWIPLMLPLLGGLLLHYLCLVTWRVVFEEAEKRRLRTIFSKVVSPKIMHELLKAESLALGGARRQITVMFADVRGFTELTDTSQERVAEFVRKNKLSGVAAESAFDDQARETLDTVNLYLGLVADVIIKHDATLDKFIGDCVMAFWGAPTPNPNHACACVRAAIDAQRAIHELNVRRAEENKKRELENLTRVAAGLEPRPMLPRLLLGSGINTGMATAGLMGSEAGTANYTVFGREVNLASRLESASGRGRIFIGETTYEHLLRDDPALAATCIAQGAQKVKGISSAVKVYEVPWRLPGSVADETEMLKSATPDSTAFALSPDKAVRG